MGCYHIPYADDRSDIQTKENAKSEKTENDLNKIRDRTKGMD